MTIGERIFDLLFVIAVLLIVFGVPLFLLTGGMQRFAVKPLRKRFEGLELHESPMSGDVSFFYHTYRGLLLWFVQDEFRVYAPPEDARKLLGRLLRFNLTWGMLSYGALFVPFLAIGNYFAQKRSIEAQEWELTRASKQDLK